MGVTGIVLAVLSLCFILIDIDIFMKTSEQNACFALNAFNPILNQTKTLPDKVIADFEKDSRLEDAANMNYTLLGSPLTDSMPTVDQIITDLEAAAKVPDIANDQVALDEVNNAIAAYKSIKQLLSSGGLPRDLTSYGKQVLTFQSDIEQIIRNTATPSSTTATSNINDVYHSVMNTIDGVTNAMRVTGSLIENAANQIEHATNNLKTAYGTTTDDITYLLGNDWLNIGAYAMVILLLFAAISAIIAIIFGSIYLSKQSLAPGGKSSCILFTFGFIVLVLTSIVNGPSLFLMIYGYSAQASCQPFFYDRNLKGLQTMGRRLPTFPIPAMNGGYVNTTFADVMLTCMRAPTEVVYADITQETTFFDAAANGQLVIYQNVMELALNYTQVLDQFKNAMNSTTIHPIDKFAHDNIWNATYTITAPHDLTKAAAEAPATINPILQEIAKWQNDLQPTIMGIRRICTDTDGLLDEDSIKRKINQEMDNSLKTINNAMGNAADSLYTSLYHSGEPCSKLTRSYADAGDLGCKGTPIVWVGQGLWPAAGLAGLFFVPLALSLLCLGNAHRHGKQPTAKPATSPPVPSAHSQKPAAPAARAEAVAPVVPVRVTSKKDAQWQQAPQGFAPPVQQPQPMQPQFIDPLAFGAAAPPTAGAGAYRGGPLPGGYHAGHPPAGYP